MKYASNEQMMAVPAAKELSQYTLKITLGVVCKVPDDVHNTEHVCLRTTQCCVPLGMKLNVEDVPACRHSQSMFSKALHT